MAGVEAIESQLQTKRAIERSLLNLRKLGKEKWTKATLRTRIAHLQDHWQKFNTGNDRVCSIIPPADQTKIPYFSENQFEETEETYLETLAFMTSQLDDLTSVPVSHPSNPCDGQVLPPVPADQLPRLNLPEFDGRYATWESFRDRFTALIIKNPSLHDVSRLHYLTSSITGRALECIENIPITEDNFTVAWTALMKRYQNPRRLINAHLQSLFDLPALSHESAADLQRLRDRVCVITASLKNLGRKPEDLWNDILVHLVSQKLDTSSRKAWKLKISDDVAPPPFELLSNFVDSRVRGLEEFSESESVTAAVCPVATMQPAAGPSRVHAVTTYQTSTKTFPPCPVCRASHNLSACPQFTSRNPHGRRELISKLNRCFNCLSNAHTTLDCSSKYSCRVCHRRHHSLLHEDVAPPPSGNSAPVSASSEVSAHLASTREEPSSAVLLATALVKLSVSSGRCVTVRALIDQGSETSFVTEAMVHILRAKRTRVNTSISAVGGVHAGSVRHAVHLQVAHRSRATPAMSTVALVLPALSTYAPKRIRDSRVLAHLADLEWADPDPSNRSAIHLILGADVYPSIVLDGVRKCRSGSPVAQETIFGWVISGPTACQSGESDTVHAARSDFREFSRISMHHCTQDDPLAHDLKRFWELEEVPRRSFLTPDEEQCESHFRANTTRTADGQYVVRLPFRAGPPINIGQSRPLADQIHRSLQRKFRLNSSLASEYRAFLHEYEELGHMRRALSSSTSPTQAVYMPHHPVFREGSATTHLRVVFNASSVTSNGTSLNDHLLSGPKLQSDLPSVLLRWRKFRYVYTADIAKMYRQILVNDRDLDYQRIIWQNSPGDEPAPFQLLTVTYGMTCAPFLALRVLQQLLEDEGSRFPLARPILRSNIYVDDVLFGGDDIPSLRRSRDQLNGLLHCGHFKLRKWASNHSELLTDMDPSDHGLACSKFLTPDDEVKILGVSWNPSRDAFQFQVSLSNTLPSTKRTILSTIAKLYDPLGWVTPAIISAKVIIQDLWRLRIAWDDPISGPALDRWTAIYTRLLSLAEVQIPRWTGHSHSNGHLELHGFADASNIAYAAVIYARCISPTGQITVSLLAGKSKVAPLTPVTIPRLELQGAELLSRLMAFVLSAFENATVKCFCWTDSTVVLAWLRSHPSKWKPYVANRVANIQTRLPNASWQHVPTAENPADCASRGLLSDDLLRHELWWHGPEWLGLDASAWPAQAPLPEGYDLPEVKLSFHSAATPSIEWDLASRFSKWPKLLRVTAYIIRFSRLCRRNISDTPSRPSGQALSTSDVSLARIFWIKHLQSAEFPEELHALQQAQSLSPKSPLLSLNPFLDADGILRVGGRLRHAALPHRVRHPILLAPHPIVRLLVEQVHTQTLHGGVQLTLHTLRQNYWLLRARSMVKSIIHSCVTCVRERAAVPEQIMGNLPDARVSPPARCFAHCGVDYAGPFHIRASAGRGITSRKAYIALFICMATRAIHLELAVDYSTPAFLNAYLRFCSRRGLPEAVYSDNGTNFVGGCRELSAAYRAAIRNPNFLNKTASDGTTWHFIPPSAPHFGGLWEAGVKSVKHHLRRVLGDRMLTFEEFTTLLCAIEACLNSRPLAPISDTLDEYETLTPGHFLVGSSLTVPPQPSYLDLCENRLSRWQLVRHAAERFWRLWQDDYINTLQQRSKWRKPYPPISTGQLVLIRNPTLPPCKWELGRVTQLHSGDDGHTRVVTVKTATATFKRPLVKLCLLPVQRAASAT
ncbi:uncharacterized protein LOC143219898 [Lasioglossum baleicum]|uniref:uncharacterized protein LOC143219898 n=1 Tax=Lasioglossum baleicum TaxID=434251 RepID=UPI003FCC8838